MSYKRWDRLHWKARRLLEERSEMAWLADIFFTKKPHFDEEAEFALQTLKRQADLVGDEALLYEVNMMGNGVASTSQHELLERLRSHYLMLRKYAWLMWEYMGVLTIDRPRRGEATLVREVNDVPLRRWKPKLVRPGSHIRYTLSQPRMEWPSSVFLERESKLVEKAKITLRTLREQANLLRDEIRLICVEVINEADLRGINVHVHDKCCKGERCGTCMGIYPWHYPYFLIYNGKKEVMVRSRELRDFLRQFIGDEAIRRLELLRTLRTNFLVIHNYALMMWEFMGVLKIDRG